MTSLNWEHVIWSAPKYEKLIADVSYANQFLYQLDWEDGRENIHIAFLKTGGEMGEVGKRIPLKDFIERLQMVAADLCI